MQRTGWLAVFALAALVAGSATAIELPVLRGQVMDRAGMIGAATRRSITNQLSAHESRTGNQVVVVTLPDLQGALIETVALAFARGWQLGEAERDNGVLLLIARAERQIRIEVGYGLEGALTDATASSIIRNDMRPRFRRGDIDAGVQAGVNAILAAIAGEYVAQAPRQRWQGLVPFLLLLAVFVVCMWIAGRHPGLWSGRSAGYGGYGGWGGSGHSSGGFGGGGGFSGGGGSFGGGGASGGW